MALKVDISSLEDIFRVQAATEGYNGPWYIWKGGGKRRSSKNRMISKHDGLACKLSWFPTVLGKTEKIPIHSVAFWQFRTIFSQFFNSKCSTILLLWAMFETSKCFKNFTDLSVISSTFPWEGHSACPGQYLNSPYFS